MKRLMIFFLLMALASLLPAAGQTSSNTAELGWLELPAFSEDPEHFFVSHYTDEYWGKQHNYSLFWDMKRQIPLWVAYPLNEQTFYFTNIALQDPYLNGGRPHCHTREARNSSGLGGCHSLRARSENESENKKITR